MRIGGPGWFGRLLTVGLGAIVLVTAAMLSLILLAVLFAVGMIVVGYLWWKTRELRRQARTFGDNGRIVDVEVVHRDVADDDSTRR
jgi:Flp pilus assembly protein TadB